MDAGYISAIQTQLLQQSDTLKAHLRTVILLAATHYNRGVPTMA